MHVYIVFCWRGFPRAQDPLTAARPLGTIVAPTRAAAHEVAAHCWAAHRGALRVRRAEALPVEWLLLALCADGVADLGRVREADAPRVD